MSRLLLKMYLLPMIAVQADNDRVQITIPTAGMTREEVNDFVAWLRVESIARRSKLTPEAAWQLSEEIKAGWWETHGPRFSSPQVE